MKNFLVGMVLSFAIICSVDAATYYVSSAATGAGNGTKSNPFTLQQAIAKSSAGDIFYLSIGEYNLPSSLNFSKDGTAANPIKWIGYISNYDYSAISSNGTNSTLLRNLTNSSNGPISMSGDFNIFDKIIFQQEYEAKQLLSVGGTGVVLDSCSVKYPSNASSSSNHTILVTGVNVTFRYSHFYNGSRTIIWVRKNSGTQADNFIMEYCTLTHATNHPPIQIMPATNSTDPTTIKRPIVRNCLFIDNPYSDGIYSRYCEQFAFYNNLFIRSSIPLSIDIHTGFNYPTGSPTDTCNSKGGICAYNTIIENGASSIIFNSGTNQTNFLNNIFYSSYTAQDFIFRFDSPNNPIYRHKFDHNLYYIAGKTFGGTNTVRGSWGANSSVWWSSWISTTGQDAHTIVNQVPTFANMSDDDYSPLNSASPQVGKGTPITIANGYWMDITTDYFDNPRDPDNPTIGAIEYLDNSNGNYISIHDGWNMISIPRLSQNMSAGYLIPTAISSIFSFYNNSYQSADTLKNGYGYLALFNGPQRILVDGEIIDTPIPVSPGWNLVGPFNHNVFVSQINSSPPSIIISDFFEFTGSQFVAANILKPGQGYWVRSASSGIINYNTDIISKGVEKNLLSSIDQEWGRIKFTDSDGKTITLYIAETNSELDKYELPPVPPNGIFDVRFRSGRFVETIGSSQKIMVNSGKYPITIEAEGIEIKVMDGINGNLLNEELIEGKKINISNNNITLLQISGIAREVIRLDYQLNQNYPNPFNPTTTISWHSPVGSHQTLKVYDVLGNEVATLVNEYRNAGSYNVEFRVQKLKLSSGIYFYKLQAGTFVETKKMILLK